MILAYRSHLVTLPGMEERVGINKVEFSEKCSYLDVDAFNGSATAKTSEQVLARAKSSLSTVFKGKTCKLSIDLNTVVNYCLVA